MTDEQHASDEEAWKQFTALIGTTQIYVQPSGCVELSQERDDDRDSEPEMVHICSQEWARVVQSVNEILTRRELPLPSPYLRDVTLGAALAVAYAQYQAKKQQ